MSKALTKEYLQSFESLADQQKINLSFKSQAKEYKIYIDVEKYRKILANLLSNAFKFIDEGGKVSVELSQVTHSEVRGNDETFIDSREGLEIRVIDSGSGIPPEKLSHIFDRFYQVNEDVHKHLPGTGIGLALTKELVDLHSGTIQVESEIGTGTVFKIFFPFGNSHFKEKVIVLNIEEEQQIEDPAIHQ